MEIDTLHPLPLAIGGANKVRAASFLKKTGLRKDSRLSWLRAPCPLCPTDPQPPRSLSAALVVVPVCWGPLLLPSVESRLWGALWLMCPPRKAPLRKWKSGVRLESWPRVRFGSCLALLDDLSLSELKSVVPRLLHCPVGTLGEQDESEAGWPLLLLGELQSRASVKSGTLPLPPLPRGGVATRTTIDSLVQRGRRPDSRYSTSSSD